MALRTAHPFAFIFLSLVGLAAAGRVLAWAPVGYTWDFGRSVVMHLQLERPAVAFQDGSSSWMDSAIGAMNLWNQRMNTVRFVPDGPAPSFFGDGVNTARFSDTIYGESFGSNVLAVTVWTRIFENPSAITEAEVFFNNAKRFDSYRGPLQSDQEGPVFDFHRVALHEFGHCLGFAHPDENGQSVASIMNSVISDLDHLAEDDINGVQSLYWTQVIGQSASVTVRFGHSFFYQLFAENNPTGFSASGLPPGISIDPVTGILSGKPLKSGTYDVQVAAHGPGSTLSGSLRITTPPSRITSSPVVFPILGQAFTYQIQTDLEPVSFEASGLPTGLTLDPVTGLISGIPSISGSNSYNGAGFVTVTAHGAYENATATVSMNVCYPLPPTDPPLKVLDFYADSLVRDPVRRRIYAVTSVSTLRVVDGDTLAVIKELPCEGIAGARIADDGRTLWIGRYRINSLARLDLDALDQIVDVPTLPNVAMVYEGLGGRVYAARGSNVVQLETPSGPVQREFTPGEGFRHMTSPQIALSADKKTLYTADTFYVGTSVVTHSALSRYDISTEVPVLLQRVEMPAHQVSFVLSPSGDSLFVKLGHFEGIRHTKQRTLCLSAADLAVTKGEFNYEGEAGPLTITPDSKLALQMIQVGDGSRFITALLKIFDTTTFALRKTIVLGSTSDGFSGIGLATPVLDAGGSRIITGATGLDSSYTGHSLMVYSAQLPPIPVPAVPPRTLLNLSTRLKTVPGEGSLIGGFIITGLESKRVIIRALGPTLPMAGKLTDPVLELHGPNGRISTSDNWNEQRDDVLASYIPPWSEYESALVATLPPGAYTAVLGGTGGSSGVAVLEIYDLKPSNSSELANIATRGKVEGGDNVLIGGMIVGGEEATSVAIRAIGPSLTANGISGILPDPVLEVYDGQGALLAHNDDWRAGQAQQLMESGLAPADDRESALLLSLPQGNCTAVVRGKNAGIGVALVEIYNLDSN